MKQLPYQKPVLIDLKKNDAMIGVGKACPNGSVPTGPECTAGKAAT